MRQKGADVIEKYARLREIRDVADMLFQVNHG
jgi:hypothetical protein